jgi:glycerol-3-phosphate dehydrogenase
MAEKIDEENTFIMAEVLYTLRYELTNRLIDVFCRRTEMAIKIHHENQQGAAEKVAEFIANEYSWSDERKNQEIEEYLNYIQKTVSFVK